MKIRVGLSQTINIGNFENVRPSVEVEDEPQHVGWKENTDGENEIAKKTKLCVYETPEECYDRLSKLCHKLLYKEIIKFEQQTENNKSSS